MMSPLGLLAALGSAAVTGAAAYPDSGAPLVILVASLRGEVSVPVRLDSLAGPTLAAHILLPALGATGAVDGAWAEVGLGARRFRFLLGAPFYLDNGLVRPLVGTAAYRQDTLHLPLQFITEVLPRAFAGRFVYDTRAARLTDRTSVAAAPAPPARDADRLPNGLRRGHVVTVDAGHGGPDQGNPGLFFPNGLKEEDVTLAVSLLLRDELRRRGVGVVMTRSTDTLIHLRDRGRYCTAECDLFVSVHVNSLPRRPGYTRIRGFETYVLAEAKTEDAARVARMENEAVRFEGAPEEVAAPFGLDFILKDLQTNEHLRESARAAELVQSYLQPVHTGNDLGVKQAGFMVLTTARRPAILVELGYSTNPEDAALLTNRASQRNLARAVADAVVAYLLEYERKLGLGPVSSTGTGAKSR